MIEFTGYTQEGDEIMEWQDTETSPEQHQVYVGRETRGLDDIVFSFNTQEKAHILFNALMDATRIFGECDKATEPQKRRQRPPSYLAQTAIHSCQSFPTI